MRVIDIVVCYTVMIPVVLSLVVFAVLFKPIPAFRRMSVKGLRKVNEFLESVAS